MRPMIRVAVFGSWLVVGAACGSPSSSNEAPSNANAGTPPSGGDIVRADDAGASTTDALTGPACATGKAVAQRQAIYADILLDGSRSMDGHGGPTAQVPCDVSADTDTEPNDCFLVGAREPDPLASKRDMFVCHRPENSNAPGKAASSCPGFIGLTGKKWLAARGALEAYVDGLAAVPNANVGLGFFLVSSTTVKSPKSWDVPIAVVDATQAAAVKARIAPGTWPEGGTPLKATIEGQAALLRSFTPTAPLAADGKRVFVLMTDGVPNGSSTKQAVIDAVNAAKNATPSITTFVVGLGDPSANEDTVYDEKFLSSLASAGGAAPAGCNATWDGQNPNGTVPCHLQVTPGTNTAAQIRSEIAAAIDSIAASAQSCEFSLDQTAAIDPVRVNVVARSGKGIESQVPADASNGWTYDSPSKPTKVILHGAACDALKTDAGASLEIVIGCVTGTPIR